MKKIKPNLKMWRRDFPPKEIYQGPQERGRLDFLNGISRKANPFSDTNKGQRWDSGWIKTKLAKEQGKKAL